MTDSSIGMRGFHENQARAFAEKDAEIARLNARVSDLKAENARLAGVLQNVTNATMPGQARHIARAALLDWEAGRRARSALQEGDRDA